MKTKKKLSEIWFTASLLLVFVLDTDSVGIWLFLIANLALATGVLKYYHPNY